MTRNLFLETLTPADRQRLAGYLKHGDLERGEHLYNEGERIRYVYFPEGALISMLFSTEGEQSLETVMVGCEGASGLASVLGDGISSHEVVVQHPGPAWRLEAASFYDLFMAGGSFQRYALRYNQYMFLMATQSAFCSANHRIEARLARWLLMSQDSAGSDSLQLTQDFLAAMLGVQRTSVTAAALSLRKMGTIRYNRGCIHIQDRDRLAALACCCYAAIRDRAENLLTPVSDSPYAIAVLR